MCRTSSRKSSRTTVLRTFTLKLFGSYPQRDYCVQYRESSFEFVSRLLEEEGIFYFFEHTAAKHQLILADDKAGCVVCPSQKTARISACDWVVFCDDDVIEGVDRFVRARNRPGNSQ